MLIDIEFLLFVLKCSCTLVIRWRVDIPMYVTLASREHVNLYTTLDRREAGVWHFNGKYDPNFFCCEICWNMNIVPFVN